MCSSSALLHSQLIKNWSFSLDLSLLSFLFLVEVSLLRSDVQNIKQWHAAVSIHFHFFFIEMRCWNPLQADKYLYTWLPDLIAFCKGDGVGVTLNAVPQYIVFFFCYPILCPSQLPHLNKNMSSMLGCPQKDWSRAEGKSARCNRTHVTSPEWRCCILLPLFLSRAYVGCLFYSNIWKAVLTQSLVYWLYFYSHRSVAM